ncbi:RsiV family protein [Alteribacillus sp. HJP-4]|uniref:RsiV family protein n=1 Tax=Alteribacillus sp. HJP-4 TaxID=2775394 RepID=UPI0035CCFBC0
MNDHAAPVVVQTRAFTDPNLFILYPYVFLPQPDWQLLINNSIQEKIFGLFSKVKEMGYYEPGVTEYRGSYEMKNNQLGILSFTFSSFANMPGLAHPVNGLNSLTFNATTGEITKLSDLFMPNSHYVERLNELILEQIEARNIPLLNGFPGISRNQSFYLADKTVVIYFDQYEISPGYVGFPTFPIPGFKIQDILNENSVYFTLLT